MGVQAGQALPRKVVLEPDLKGLARFLQAEEGKKSSVMKSTEAGRHVAQLGTGHSTAEHESQERAGSGNGAGPRGWAGLRRASSPALFCSRRWGLTEGL